MLTLDVHPIEACDGSTMRCSDCSEQKLETPWGSTHFIICFILKNSYVILPFNGISSKNKGSSNAVCTIRINNYFKKSKNTLDQFHIRKS